MVSATNTELLIKKEEQGQSPSIKILVGENMEGALVEAKGPYKVVDPLTNQELSRGSRLKRYYLQQRFDGLKWGEGYPGVFQIKIVPESPDTSILVDGIQYKGSLEVYSVEGEIHLVNELPIELYLKSYLTSNLAKKRLPKVSLDALAIVARTDLYHKVTQNKRAFWHLHGKEIEYNGYAATTAEIDRAVNSTEFLIMLHKNRPFPATWTENCAGITADFRSIFRKNFDAPEGIASAFARKDREQSKWISSISITEFEKKIPIQGLKAIDLYRDPKTDKVYGIKIKGAKETRSFDFQDFWNRLGKDQLLSNDMTLSIDPKTNQIFFEGYGEGLGVGLCVLSTNAMARNGDSAPEILATFFPSTSITKLEKIPSHMFLSEEDFIKFKKKG